MEILFENRYYSDKKILTEYIKDVHCRYLRIIGFFFMLVAMLYTYLILFKMKSLHLVMAALTIVIFIVSLRLIFYHLLYLTLFSFRIIPFYFLFQIIFIIYFIIFLLVILLVLFLFSFVGFSLQSHNLPYDF